MTNLCKNKIGIECKVDIKINMLREINIVFVNSL